MVVLRNAHGVIFKPSDSKESETAPASPDCRHNKPGQAWSQGGVCVSFCSLACDCVLMKRLWGGATEGSEGVELWKELKTMAIYLHREAFQCFQNSKAVLSASLLLV